MNDQLQKVRPYLMPVSVVLLSLILILQVMLYITVNPAVLANQVSSVARYNDAVKKVPNAPLSLPVSMGVVGDKVTLASADEIRKANAIDAEVYKDAKDGDAVLNYVTRLVIIRQSEAKPIYDGDSSAQKLTAANNTLVSSITKLAKESSLISEDLAKTTPVTGAVANADELKKINPLYANIANNDIIAEYKNGGTGVMVVYRPTENKIITSGKIETTVK